MGKRTGVVRSLWWCRAMTMVGVLLLLWAPVSQGQTTSITSSGLNTQVSHVAGQPNYDITGGTRPGNGTNLFHSFGAFSVGANDIANFRNDSGLATSNILGRVTGGNPSNIFGTIQTTGFGNANLFLMNPAGMVFGPNASLNVGGSVTLTTADYIKLADGVRFKALANSSADGLLSAAPVAAFGFLGSHPGAITVQGSQLTVAEGKGLSLVGGDIRITGGALTAQGGQINLASLAGRGEASIRPEGITIAGSTARGHIEIKGGPQPADVAKLDTSGDGGGGVVIRGGQLSLARAEVITGAKADNQRGGDIVIEATKSATLDNVGLLPRALFERNDPPYFRLAGGAVSLAAPTVSASNLTIDTSGLNGRAGDVAINVRNLTASNLNILSSAGLGDAGPASGSISIRATGDVTLYNSRIESSTFERPDAGPITIRAGSLTLVDTRIRSDAISVSGGQAGDIVIDVGRLTMRTSDPGALLGRPRIETSAMEASGEGGNISVSAKEAILVYGGTISAERVGGPEGGGSITVSTPRLTLNHLGRISTGSDGTRAGDISVNVRTLNMLNGGGIGTDTAGTGGASTGNIDIVASQSISMAGVGVRTSGGLVPSGINMDAPDSRDSLGRLHIVTPTLHLSDGAVVRAYTEQQVTPVTDGIVMDVGRLDVLRGARISSLGIEGGIPIEINAAKDIILDHGTITSANTYWVGQSGEVHLRAGKSIELRNGSLISADHPDIGDAGHIAIQAGKSVVIRDSTVSAQAEHGNGGTIDVNAKQVTLTNSQLTTSVSGGPQTVGGEISVDAKTITLRNSQILSTATEGQGGSIHLRSHALRRDARSVIDASSESGMDGTVTIESRH